MCVHTIYTTYSTQILKICTTRRLVGHLLPAHAHAHASWHLQPLASPGGVFFAAWGAAGEDFDPGTKFFRAVPPPKTHFEDAWRHRSSTPSPAPSRTPATVRRTLLGTGLAAAYHHPSLARHVQQPHRPRGQRARRGGRRKEKEGGRLAAPAPARAWPRALRGRRRRGRRGGRRRKGPARARPPWPARALPSPSCTSLDLPRRPAPPSPSCPHRPALPSPSCPHRPALAVGHGGAGVAPEGLAEAARAGLAAPLPEYTVVGHVARTASSSSAVAAATHLPCPSSMSTMPCRDELVEREKSGRGEGRWGRRKRRGREREMWGQTPTCGVFACKR